MNDFQRYGMALAKFRNGSNLDEVMHEFRTLLEVHPDNVWLASALAQTQARAGQRHEAGERFDALLRRLSGQRAVVLMYAEMLNEGGNLQDGKRAQALLLPLLRQLSEDALFQQTFARSCELAGATAAPVRPMRKPRSERTSGAGIDSVAGVRRRKSRIM